MSTYFWPFSVLLKLNFLSLFLSRWFDRQLTNQSEPKSNGCSHDSDLRYDGGKVKLLTCWRGHTSHSEGLLSPDSLNSCCTAHSSPQEVCSPETHTHTNTLHIVLYTFTLIPNSTVSCSTLRWIQLQQHVMGKSLLLTFITKRRRVHSKWRILDFMLSQTHRTSSNIHSCLASW